LLPDEPELAREEDFIALSSMFEPFAQELFTVTIEAILTVSTLLHTILDRYHPQKAYSELSQNLAPSS
jgi:hypothetical protein